MGMDQEQTQRLLERLKSYDPKLYQSLTQLVAQDQAQKTKYQIEQETHNNLLAQSRQQARAAMKQAILDNVKIAHDGYLFDNRATREAFSNARIPGLLGLPSYAELLSEVQREAIAAVRAQQDQAQMESNIDDNQASDGNALGWEEDEPATQAIPDIDSLTNRLLELERSPSKHFDEIQKLSQQLDGYLKGGE
jgi:hypothetical protein